MMDEEGPSFAKSLVDGHSRSHVWYMTGLQSQVPYFVKPLGGGDVAVRIDDRETSYWLYVAPDGMLRPMSDRELNDRTEPWEQLEEGTTTVTAAMAVRIGFPGDAVGKQMKMHNVPVARMLDQHQTEIEEIHERVQNQVQTSYCRKGPYYDMLVNKVAMQPEEGRMLCTFTGFLYQLPDGELTFTNWSYVRSRLEDGQEMPGDQEADWIMHATTWFEYFLASFLEFVHSNREAYAGFIKPVPQGCHPKLRRLSLMEQGAKPAAWGVPKHLWTGGTGYDPRFDIR